MSNTQHIACPSCKEYLDTDKFCPDDRFNSEYHGVYNTDHKNTLRTIESTKAGFLKEHPNHYWKTIIPKVLNFIELHGNHELIIVKDGADSPWYDSALNWFDWKKLDFSNEYDQDTELPRNIIEDLEIMEWNIALEHYKTNCVFIDDPEQLKQPFLKHLESFKTKHKLH
ncbi:MAG: hypothetical protein ACI8ZM_003296 [Crocinitomix sp.]|jgi:hypothetical protein